MTDYHPILIEHFCSITPSSQKPDSVPSDWFEPRQYLGKRGFKYLASSCQYLLASCEVLKEQADIDTFDPIRTGMVIGTNFGLDKTLQRLDSDILEYGPESVSPMMAPNFCINMVASQASIRFAIHGFNLTLTTPWVAGLDSLIWAARELYSDTVDTVIAGAAEEAAPMTNRRYLCGAVTCLTRRISSGDTGLILVRSYEGFLPPLLPASSLTRFTASFTKQFASLLPTATKVLILADSTSRAALADEILNLSMAGGVRVTTHVLTGASTLEPLLTINEVIRSQPGNWLVLCCTEGGQIRALQFQHSQQEEAVNHD